MKEIFGNMKKSWGALGLPIRIGIIAVLAAGFCVLAFIGVKKRWFT